MSEQSGSVSVSEYVHVFELLPDYQRRDCPDCGEEQWFRETEYGPQCIDCRAYLRKTVEVVCPDCDTRMVTDAGEWVCNLCGATRDFPRDELIDRLSDTDAYAVRGMPGELREECPICGAEETCGDSDGTILCRECSDLYLGQYMDQWFAYAHWLAGEHETRVHEEGAI